MKKIILTVISIITICSCDKIYRNQLYVINNCNEPIYMFITNTWGNIDTFMVEANATFMFDEGQGIASPKEMIEQSFVKLEITKNGILSNVNYRDFDRWIYKENGHQSELYLMVNSEDFPP